MGGIGFYIKIERVSESATPLPALHQAVWDHLTGAFQWLTKAGNRVTTSDYLWSSAYDGLRDGEGGEWDHSETELGFWFRDAAGCCNMSCNASLHWAEMSFANSWTRISVPGWKVIPPETQLANELVIGPSYPLVYVRRGMFAAVRRERNKPLGADETEAGFGDSTRLEWSDLKGKDRDTVEWSALTGLCQCDICTRYRSRWLPPKLRYKPADHLTAARAAWELLDGGEQRSLEDEAAAVVRRWDWSQHAGPPELQVLSDWLVKHDATLPTDALASMVASRARR